MSSGQQEALCETCLERGRVRRADFVTENLQMCRNCYEGKPTCKAEEIGGHCSAPGLLLGNLQAAHSRDAKLRASRRWRENNRDRVREYNRARYARLKELGDDGR